MNENRWLRAAGAPKNRVFPPCARGGGGGGGVSSDPGALRPLSKKFWCLKPYAKMRYEARFGLRVFSIYANELKNRNIEIFLCYDFRRLIGD